MVIENAARISAADAGRRLLAALAAVNARISAALSGACTDKVRVRRDLVEEKVLDPVRQELLAPERVNKMAKEIEKHVREILEARLVARRSAKILTAIPGAAQAYRRQIELGLGGDLREAAKARAAFGCCPSGRY